MKSIAKAIYFTYQWLIAGPIFVAVTFLTAIFTAIGSLTGNKDFWGYYPRITGQDSLAPYFLCG